MKADNKEIRQYLEDYRSGSIAKGKDIGLNALDDHIRFKKGQLVMVNGHDNVGKTAWILWYFLCLSKKHGIKWCIWSGENKPGMLVRQLIEMLTGRKLNELTQTEMYNRELFVSEHFKFIDNKGFYTNKELYDLFQESKCDGALIDPYTGMNRDYSHAANYDFLNQSREFCNKTGITLYVNTHPNSEAARRTWSAGSEFEGYQMPPSRSQSEGGQPFASRTDDFITIHRMVGHPSLGSTTMIYVRKVKDTETGGSVNGLHDPINFDWNFGLGFLCGGINPLTNQRVNQLQAIKQVEPNQNFESDGVPF